MAEQKKKTTAGGSSGSKTSGGKKTASAGKRASSAGKKSSGRQSANRAAAEKKAEAIRRQRRRAAVALALFAVGVCTFLGYFKTDGVVIRLLRGLLTGLLGGGFYLLPFMLITAALFLALAREDPVPRAVSALGVPTLVAAFCQIFSKTSLELGFDMFPLLWEEGQALSGGGAVGGAVAILFRTLFGLAGAVIVLVCLSAFAVMNICGLTLRAIVDMIRESRRTRREREVEELMNEPEPEPARESVRKKPDVPTASLLEVPRPGVRRSAIDIPMDDEDMPNEPAEPEKVRKNSLFNRRPNAPAPDSLFAREEEKPVQSEPVPIEIIKREPEPEPKRPSPVPEPAPEPAVPAPTPLAPEKVTAAETAEAAGQIASLIDEKAKRELAEAAQVYKFPPVSLLNEPVRSGSKDSQDELNATKERLELCLRSFGINVNISNIVHGPSITRYEMELEIGVKLNKLTNLADDIALALGVSGVRIAAIPNRISTVGIEVPNKNVSTVYLREIITAPEFTNAKSKLTFAIGKNISGDVMVGNISKLPHLLVAGTTGSGKSVCLNSLILSLMYKATPEEVKFIMIDPKMVEFKIYNGIPHLLIPVVTEAKKAAGALQWAVVEMMKRYRTFSDAGARDIAGYNQQLDEGTPKMPQIVVIIDELADLMMIAAKEVEESICRVAQMGRAAGVHLVIATQSPRADVITGLMKANIPSRIALKVASSLESRIILDAGGAADKLVGNGDMLFAPIGASKPARIQGTWVSDEEREKVVEFVKSLGEASYSEDVIYEIEKAVQEKENGGKTAQPPAGEDKFKDYDELLPQAADIIFETNQASVSALQRRLKLGYARAARIVDQLEEVGVLGPFEGSKPRQIVMTRQQWQEMQFINGTAPIGQTPPPDQSMTSAADLFPDDNE